MVIALMGLIFSGVLLANSAPDGAAMLERGFDPGSTWAFTLMFLFGLLFIASIISMTYGPEDNLRSE